MMGRRSGRLIRGQSLPGAVLWKWEPAVPHILPSFLGSSIFLYASKRDATEGANWGGSGVFVGIESAANPSRVHLYAVTNDHVARSCPVVRLVDRHGDAYVLDGAWSDWEPHPRGDDIALRPLGALPAADYWYVSHEKLVTRADVDLDDVALGDDCLMVGRYINRELRQFDRPAVRFGNLALLPELILQDQRAFEQESFLVDMRSHAGFSGSPVFVYYEEPGWRNLAYMRPAPVPPPEPSPDADIEDLEEHLEANRAYGEALSERVADRDLSGIMGKAWLLGLDWGHLPVWDDVFDGNVKIGRMRVSTGMAGVVPAWKLRDLLDTKEVEMARDQAEKQLAEQDEAAVVLDTSQPDEFAEFEDLTKKLVQVPKRELDEKRKGES